MKARQILNRIVLVATGIVYAARIIGITGAHAANNAIGVVEYDAGVGEAVTVITQGITDVISGAAFAAGSLLTADSAGKAVAVSPTTLAEGGTVQVIGVAMEAASGADQVIQVYVSPHSSVGVKDDTITLTAGENLTAGMIVGPDGKHTANMAVGVAVAAATSGASAVIKVKGVTNVTSGAAFAVGDYLTSDADGKAVKYNPANVNIGTVIGIVGVALAAATDAAQVKSCFLCPSVAVGTKAIG